MTVPEAYEICRQIARREAKNFYYAFVALPKPKRDAICAVYAFMRQADDLSDDESFSVEERRARLGAWLDEWHGALHGEETEDPVFIALADARARFGIAPGLLDELVEGTAMDLERAHDAEGYDTYATFDDLYRYCYLVASVVGLVCIRIFGYTDKRAEELAEETGIAFQLTNILRDVREDVGRKRMYLPLEDLQKYGVTIEDLASSPAPLKPNQRQLLEAIGKRAEGYYASGLALLPLIDADSRPALHVLLSIYHRLLKQIEESGFEVFARRESVPTLTKLLILAGGIARVAAHQLGAGK